MSDPPSDRPLEASPPRAKLPSDYDTALGIFVRKYAEIEAMTLTAVRVVLRMPPSLARAVFGSVRVKENTERVNRALEVLAADKDASQAILDMKRDFKRISDQLGLITSTRNDIMHNGAMQHHEGEWVTSKSHVSSKKPSEFKTTPTILHNMTQDLGDMFTIYFHRFQIAEGQHGIPDTYAQVSARPWRYKRESPAGL